MLVVIEELISPSGDLLNFEVVERKGLGHPDTICDALAEALSLAISRRSLMLFGRILHHNVDKALLWGGTARPAFGGGEISKPIEIFLAGRALTSFGDKSIPVDELAQEITRAWFANNIPSLDLGRDIKTHSLVRQGSADLVALFERSAATAVLANDTSCGVGFAPLSTLESVVLKVEMGLTDPGLRNLHPEIGADIKVMGVRNGRHIRLVIGCAFIGRHINDLADYAGKKAGVADLVRSLCRSAGAPGVDVMVNAADDIERGSVYLTVSGTSAEAGDDGQAGRGNRVNGLITPFRPMTMESVAGKNPVTHVGKLYNIVATLITQRIVEAIPQVAEAQCILVSKIGHRIDEPQLLDLRLRPATSSLSQRDKTRAEEIARDELSRIGTVADALLSDTIRLDRWPLSNRRTDQLLKTT
ncbi:MAG: methionine adenosyltransferase [Rhodospirillaceae bacterium]|nr:methionine adenosyltransferase [Rhodospirillaceae bacterium]